MVLVVKCLICNKELTYLQSDPSELVAHVRLEHPSVNQRTRKSTTKHNEARAKAAHDIEQSLSRNSESLQSLIDREVQTDIIWSHFEKMNQQVSTPRSSKDSASGSTNVITKTPPLSPRQTASSPARLSDERKKIDDKTPLKKVPVTTTDQQKTRRSSQEKIQMRIGNDAKVLFTSKNPSNQTLADESKPERKRVKFYKTSIERWQPVGDEKIHCPRCQSHKRPIIRTHTERVTESSFLSTLLMTCWPFCLAPCLFPEPTHEKLHCPVCNFHLGIYDHQKKIVMPNPEI